MVYVPDPVFVMVMFLKVTNVAPPKTSTPLFAVELDVYETVTSDRLPVSDWKVTVLTADAPGMASSSMR
jgi:hypothetical protein